MAQMIKARPTTYKGIRMRSRLEAGFAQWLDSMPEIAWEYEPQAFASPLGQYLPDFVATGFRFPWTGERLVYFEVKPSIFGMSEDNQDFDKGFTEQMALEERMAIIWETDPDAVLMIARQRKAGGCDFTMLIRSPFGDGINFGEPARLVSYDWPGTSPGFVTYDMPGADPWPDGYWKGI